MTKEQIEAESRLIQACKMIGATYKGDKIEFASGLVADVKKDMIGLLYICRFNKPHKRLYINHNGSSFYHYRMLLRFLFVTDK